MVAGPEVFRVIKEFDGENLVLTTSDHEQTPMVQSKFSSDDERNEIRTRTNSTHRRGRRE